jgi:segregation and condensation protein A
MNEFAPVPRLARPDDEPGRGAGEAGEPRELVLDLDGYEGPIDLLLSLARTQKVDLARISILALADQYIDFIADRRFDLDIAADYLVMAAVLAYLKSCLLLPSAPKDDEPQAEEIAELLRHRLALLEAMQQAGRRLTARLQLGRDFFYRGVVDESAIVIVPRWEIGLYALLGGYAEVQRRRTVQIVAIEPCRFQSMDDALRRLARFLGGMANWRLLSSFLPSGPAGEELRRSMVAATFAAALELARRGRLELRQDQPFGPIWLRRTVAAAARGEAAVALP